MKNFEGEGEILEEKLKSGMDEKTFFFNIRKSHMKNVFQLVSVIEKMVNIKILKQKFHKVDNNQPHFTS